MKICKTLNTSRAHYSAALSRDVALSAPQKLLDRIRESMDAMLDSFLDDDANASFWHVEIFAIVAPPEQLAVKTSLEETSIPSTVTGTTKSPRTAVTGSSSTQTGGVDGSTSDSMSSQNVDGRHIFQLQL